jgi:hypothetical protein
VAFEVGHPVWVAMSKWGDQPHWEYGALWLGSDDQGDWLGLPAGTPMSRPGYALVSQNDQVALVPAADGPDGERGWFAGFHGEPRDWVDVYVDITTPPVWEGSTVRAVDLDLDVIRRVDDSVFVDDEDEFAEHRVAFGYPDDVVRAAAQSCDRVHEAVTRRLAPYDGSHGAWLAALRDLLVSRRS